jgi:hypothetical protein
MLVGGFEIQGQVGRWSAMYGRITGAQSIDDKTQANFNHGSVEAPLGHFVSNSGGGAMLLDKIDRGRSRCGSSGGEVQVEEMTGRCQLKKNLQNCLELPWGVVGIDLRQEVLGS